MWFSQTDFRVDDLAAFVDSKTSLDDYPFAAPDYFEDHSVQLSLRKGDAAFFNPALLHAAGTNRSADVRRMANLLHGLAPPSQADVLRRAVSESWEPAVLRRELSAHTARRR